MARYRAEKKELHPVLITVVALVGTAVLFIGLALTTVQPLLPRIPSPTVSQSAPTTVPLPDADTVTVPSPSPVQPSTVPQSPTVPPVTKNASVPQPAPRPQPAPAPRVPTVTAPAPSPRPQPAPVPPSLPSPVVPLPRPILPVPSSIPTVTDPIKDLLSGVTKNASKTVDDTVTGLLGR